MHHRQSNTNYRHSCLVMTLKNHPKANLETWWNNTSVFLQNDQQVPRNHCVPMETQEKKYGTTYRFQEEDAADGTSFAPSDQGRSTRQFPSSEHHKQKTFGYESASMRSKVEDLPHNKTIALILASRLLQIGDDQGPHTDDFGYNIHKMGYTQVFCRMALFRGHPIARLSDFIRLTMNSVMASPSKLPNTLEAVRCKHRSNSRRSKNR